MGEDNEPFQMVLQQNLCGSDEIPTKNGNKSFPKIRQEIWIAFS